MTASSHERVVVVVESPTRALALRRVVAPSITVLATGGRVFAGRGSPRRGGGRVLQDLRDAARGADRVLIATDPDREGEAIAADLLRFLAPAFPGRVARIHLGEDTAAGVARALAAPRAVDRGRLAARSLRDELDRRFLAAAGRVLGDAGPCGRVRALALARVVERSREAPSRWEVEVRLGLPEGRLRATVVPPPRDREAATALAAAVDAAAAEGTLAPAAIRRRRFEEPPPPPFDTAGLLEEADRLALGPERVLEAARILHRGVELADGVEPLLSYPRTDEATLELGGDGPGRPLVHGAIRPVSAAWPPERAAPFLKAAERKVYDRVWRRTAAARARAAVLEEVEVDLALGGERLRARGLRLIDPGWRAVEAGEGGAADVGSEGGAADVGSEGGAADVGSEGGPAAGEGAGTDGRPARPPRGRRAAGGAGAAAVGLGVVRGARAIEHPGAGPFRPGELIGELARLGVGRPSTWATIARGLREAGLVRGEGGRLVATEEGRRIDRALREAFGARLSPEEAAATAAGLRAVEEGRLGAAEFRRRFLAPLDEVGGPRGPRCPACGRTLLGAGTCSGFPVCRGAG